MMMARSALVLLARSVAARMVSRFGCLVLGCLVLAIGAGVARAEFIGSNLVWVSMENSQGSSALVGLANPYDNEPDGPSYIEDGVYQRQELRDGDELLGYVDELAVALDGDPEASINFSLTAGGSDVTVTVSSATVSFASLLNPPASAEAEVTLTDNGGSPATIETVGSNDGLFRAIYNSTQEYTWLLGDGSVGGGSVLFSEDESGPVAGSVSSIQAQFAFELSAGDTAMGSGRFTVVPEPATAALLLMGAATLLGARRRTMAGSMPGSANGSGRS